MKMRFFTLSLCFLILMSNGLAAIAQESTAGAESPPLLEQSEALAGRLQQLESELRDLYEKAMVAEGEERLLLETQMRLRGTRIREDIDSFIKNIIALREQDSDASQLEARAETLLATLSAFIKNEIEQLENANAELVKAKGDATQDEVLELEQEQSRNSVGIDNLLKSFSEVCEYKQDLGIEVGPDYDYFDERLQERADALSGQILLAQEQTSELSAALAEVIEDEKPNINASLVAARERLHSSSTSLSTTVNLMDERGLDTAKLKQILITSTGQITSDIFDIQVAAGLLQRWWNSGKEWLATNAPQFIFKLILFFLILLAFKMLARVATRLVKRAFASTDAPVPVLVKDMAISFTSKAIVLLGLFVALSQMGLEIGPLLAGVGVAGFILGFALQETLSNFASGLMILVYHPFDVGDVVEAGGVAGKVGQMSLVSTTIMTFDNQKLIVPNNKIWGDVIRNKTSEAIRRVDMVFGIGYSDDIDRAERVLSEIVRSHNLVLDDPEPMIRLSELGDSSVDFIVRPWTKTGDYWTVHWDITREVKKRFDAQGISIPFPQRDVHLYQEAVAFRAEVSSPPQEDSSRSPVDRDVLDEGGDPQN